MVSAHARRFAPLGPCTSRQQMKRRLAGSPWHGSQSPCPPGLRVMSRSPQKVPRRCSPLRSWGNAGRRPRSVAMPGARGKAAAGRFALWGQRKASRAPAAGASLDAGIGALPGSPTATPPAPAALRRQLARKPTITELRLTELVHCQHRPGSNRPNRSRCDEGHSAGRPMLATAPWARRPKAPTTANAPAMVFGKA